MSESRLVWSSDGGDRRPRGRKARPTPGSRGPQLPADGVVRIFRDRGGRGGKVVTVVRGLPAADREGVARDLKRRCGSGGAVKGDAVEIQGDHRETVAQRLRAQGYTVKLAGG